MPNLLIIDLRNNLLLEMHGFEKCQNLRELHLCENKIAKIKGIDTLKQLQLLDLRGNYIT